MCIKKTWFTESVVKTSHYYSFINKQVLDVINSLCWKKDDWVAAVYDNEGYPGVVAEVGWILAYVIDKLTCF